LAETDYFIHLSKRLKYLDDASHALLASATDEAARVLTGLIQSVQVEI
jgi:hypothetical protein